MFVVIAGSELSFRYDYDYCFLWLGKKILQLDLQQLYWLWRYQCMGLGLSFVFRSGFSYVIPMNMMWPVSNIYNASTTMVLIILMVLHIQHLTGSWVARLTWHHSDFDNSCPVSLLLLRASQILVLSRQALTPRIVYSSLVWIPILLIYLHKHLFFVCILCNCQVQVFARLIFPSNGCSGSLSLLF